MKYWTLQELKEKVEADLDLEGEDQITEDELTGYINEAIDKVERLVHKTHRDYFLTSTPLTLESGTEDYDFPSDIYAMKIKELVYRNGTTVYTINPLREWKKVTQYEDLKSGVATSAIYEYLIVNSTPGSPKIRLAPTPQESGQYVQFWYYRNANRLSADTDVLDIPEGAQFVIRAAKTLCYEKQKDPMIQKSQELEAEEWSEFVSMIEEMKADDHNEIPADTTLYNEMS